MKRIINPTTLLCPVPPVMVSCSDGERDNIITIAWTGIINSEPPLTYVSIRPSRYSFDMVKKTKEFVINLTDGNLAFAADYCGVKSGREVDKFHQLGLNKEKGELVDCPMIKEAPINLECKVIEEQVYGTHHMFVAEIVKVHVKDSLYDENDKLDLSKANLVSYQNGKYFQTAESYLGKTGFSVAKKK